MKAFADLFYELDQTNKTNDKVDILVRYFKDSDDEEIFWAIALFTGRRPRRVVNSTLIREWASEFAGIPGWMFDECYSVIGDLSETISLLLPEPSKANNQPLGYWIRYVKSLEKKSEDQRKAAIFSAWSRLTKQERFVFNKITSSTFRIGISQNLLIRALAIHTRIAGNVIAHRLMGKWSEDTTDYKTLLFPENINADLSKAYPFFLAHPLQEQPEELGLPDEWQAEWKWDGIRSQLIMRRGNIFIWSRGEDLITDKFPELEVLKGVLPDGCVIDGELLPFANGRVLPFAVLQTRIGRKNVTAKVLKDAPASIFAYDLLEYNGFDIRDKPLAERRLLLADLVEKVNLRPCLQLSPEIDFTTWEQLAELRLNSRQNLSEGIMLKRRSSEYGVGRKRGDWWKWKIDPMTVDAVLIYAQKGSGRRANLYTDYTFAVWNGDELISFAKAYSGLTDKEILEVDQWIRKNSIEKFGPVCTVKPALVFEIGFEAIQRSTRHKSGVAVRFPRILRWRKDKPIKEADTIETLFGLLREYSN